MRRADIEHVSGLTPVQLGMLFHVLHEPDAALYVEQGVCELQGPLDFEAFRAAWQRTLDRHAALRTAFFWRGLSQPLQVTYRAIAVPLTVSAGDEEGVADENGAAVDRVLARHRAELSTIETAPLTRLDLLRHAADRWTAVWSIHHLVHDAWSLEVILREVWSDYDARRRGAYAPLPPTRPFSDFVAWQRERAAQEAPDAARFWRDTLAPARGRPSWDGTATNARPRAEAEAGEGASRYGQTDVWLTAEESARLVIALRQASLTLNTAVLGAWSLVLAHRGGTSDALFGVVTLGRPAGFEAIDHMVGVFINTLPLYVRIDAHRPVGDWLRDVQAKQLQAAAYEQCALSDIRRWCGWTAAGHAPADANAAERPLFNTIVVFQQVFRPVADGAIGGLRVGALETRGQPNYPLMLRVTPGVRLRIELVYDRRRVEDALARQLRAQVERTLAALASRAPDAMATMGRLDISLPPLDGGGTRSGSMSQTQRAGGSRLAAVSPKPKTMRAEDAVSQDTLTRGGTRVRVLEARQPGQDPREWGIAARDLLAAILPDTGAALLRGFRPLADEEFHAFVSDVLGTPLEYRERSSPRTRVAGHVYTSTEYPAHQPIFLHNENSYADAWPTKIAFYCAVAAETGGATPVADVRAVYRQIPADVRDRFAKAGVLYVRHFTQNVGLSWQDAFQTSDRAEVDAYCAAHGYECEWLADGLRTRRRGQAVARHPVTGEPLWFNHAAFFHLSTLEPDVQQGLLAQFGEARLPNQTCYGDGRAIEPEVLDLIRAAYRAHQLSWPWRAGDLLLLDNMLVAHGREAFTGPRRILVGMADRFDHRLAAAAVVTTADADREGVRLHD
jgi:alpha-ketoglutarate-dependent taurine dioxygenase